MRICRRKCSRMENWFCSRCQWPESLCIFFGSWHYFKLDTTLNMYLTWLFDVFFRSIVDTKRNKLIGIFSIRRVAKDVVSRRVAFFTSTFFFLLTCFLIPMKISLFNGRGWPIIEKLWHVKYNRNVFYWWEYFQRLAINIICIKILSPDTMPFCASKHMLKLSPASSIL